MAQTDADERDYGSLAALRDGNSDRSPTPGAGDPAIWPSRPRADRLAGDAGFGKVTAQSWKLSRLEVIAPRYRDGCRGQARARPSLPSSRPDPPPAVPPACRGHFP